MELISGKNRTPFISLSCIQSKSQRVLKCEHCDVDAYYKLTIEYFNDSENPVTYVCIKCVRMETKKVVDDFPAIRSLKVEPILHPTILTI